MVALCRAIAPLEAPFVEFWGDSLYCNGRDRQRKSQEADDENTVSIQSMSDAIQDQFLWRYAEMLRSLLGVVQHFAR